jgi:hypothetical protein
MTSGLAAAGRRASLPRPGEPLRIAFVGPEAWLEGCCPPAGAGGLRTTRLAIDRRDPGAVLREAAALHPHVTAILEPAACPIELLEQLPGSRLGIVVGAPPDGEAADAVAALERVTSFRPALTGTPITSRARFWRAIPPPVADDLFGEVRPLHGRPRAMSVGRSTAHREQLLEAAKHHHDLLHVIHGVTGKRLATLLREYDVGVYVPPRPGGGFGHQVGVHLAAGQLLLAEALNPEHGLERDIDYLRVDSPQAISWALERLARFPEMYQRVRVRGRLKAEQYRASRLWARVAHDVLVDVAAFGAAPPGGD